MKHPFHRATLLLLLGASMGAALVAQQEPQDPQQQLERLRRDQDEILRKAGRLRDLMDRLLQRYTREGKQEQVDLLQKGLQHLERSGLLKDVASIRDDLAANALSDALRKQQEVVVDIERLLNILLQRRSIENLEQEITQLSELADRIREAEARQDQLQKDLQQTTEREPNADEQAIDQQLQELARDQASEAQKNARAAGTRRPFLEDALRKVDGLLQQQQKLEQRAAIEQTNGDADRKAQMFDLGSMIQITRELSTDVKDQGRKQDLQQAADELTDAAKNGDPTATQQARDRLQSLLQRAPMRPDRVDPAETSRTFAELQKAFENAPSGQTETERKQLQQLAGEAKAAAAASEQRERTANAESAEEIAKAGEALRQQLDAADPRPASERKPDDSTPANSLQKASTELLKAAGEARSGDAQKAQASLQQALRSLEEARTAARAESPDAQNLAEQMAAQADATERELRNAPSGEAAEQQAAEALAKAEQALREASAGLQQQQDAREGSTQGARPEGAGPQGSQPQGSQPQGSQPQGSQPQDSQPQTPPTATTESMQDSRQALEQAKQTLEQALKEAGNDRTDEMAMAKERQQELRQRAEQAKQSMQQAKERGAIDEKQAKAAGEQMQRAQQAMQQAEQSLQQGQQSTASQQQREATQAIQQAQQAIQENKQPGPEQQQAMKDLAEQQKQLEDEILRLAEEAKQRKNPEARRSLEEAAESSRKAQQAMQQGDEEEAQQQQEKTEQKLQEAAEQLEEERDRYLDQRQEELLFRMKEELTAFLEKQQPMTLETIALQKEAESGNLSRASRRKLNQFGEEEQALAGRLQTMIGALTEEGNLVYRTVLQANFDDVQEVARRLAGRNPDASRYTTMLQQDVERRTRDLLAALEREQKRREQEQKDQQQQQQQEKQPGENKFNEQRKKLVSLIAELEMLKQLEKDTATSSQDLQTLISLREGDDVSQAELALVERLMHRHAEITKLFQQIKQGVEQTMEGMQQQDGENEDPHGGDGSGGTKK